MLHRLIRSFQCLDINQLHIIFYIYLIFFTYILPKNLLFFIKQNDIFELRANTNYCYELLK